MRKGRETLAAKKQVSRTQYLVDNDGLSKVLALLASRNYKEAITFAKKIFYAKMNCKIDGQDAGHIFACYPRIIMDKKESSWGIE